MTLLDESVVLSVPHGPTTKRQRALLQSLSELFAAEGFAHLTLDDMASRLHCSKSSLYRLAPSKDELVVAVMSFRGAQFFGELEERMSNVEGGRAQLETWIQYAREQKNASSERLMDDAISFRPTRELWQQGGARHTARLGQLISDGIGSGEFRPLSPEFVGYAIAFLLDGIRRNIATSVTGLSEDEVYDTLLEVVFAASVRTDLGIDRKTVLTYLSQY